MKSRCSGAVLGLGLLVVLFGGGGTAEAASPWGGPWPGWGPPGHVPTPAWRPVAFAPQRPAWIVPAPYGVPDYRWRPLADARAVALQRLAAAAWRPMAWSPPPAVRLPVVPAWGVAPAGAMVPPSLAAGWAAAPRHAAHPAGARAGRPAVVTLAGQPYRFRPLPPSGRQVAVFAPPQWRPGAMPVRLPVAWAPVPPGPRYVQPALRLAPASSRAGWLVYRFRPDTRFPHGETLQLPAGARLSHAATGSDWQTGEPTPQGGHQWRSGYVYN